MTWGLAQAGNRAGRTGRYLQWWEHGPEWNAVTPGLQNLHDSASFLVLAALASESFSQQGCRRLRGVQGAAGKKLFTLLDLCVSSLRRGHANLLCIMQHLR